MTERLDRLEAILLIVGERLDAVAAQQQRNTEDIDTLLGAVSTNEVELRKLIENAAESNQRFDILRAEAIADRQRSDRAQEEFRQRFENLREEAIADRQQVERDRTDSRQRFDAQQEVIQRLLGELVATNRDVQRVSDRVQNIEAS